MRQFQAIVVCFFDKIEGIGLSSVALQILKDSGITADLVSQFTDSDVADLFNDANFLDRFKLRQFIKTLNEDSSPPQMMDYNRTAPQDDAPVRTSASVYGKSNDESSAASTSRNSNGTQEDRPHHSVRDMLRTKEQRGTPSEAQVYFQSMIRDAAMFARIWTKAPKIKDIPDRKKEAFLATICERCPELSTWKKEVWAKFKAALQNRRKYLLDLSMDKRQVKGKHGSENGGKSYRMMKAGDPVIILGKEGQIVGKGVYLSSKNTVYSEVAVRSIVQDDESDELPEPVDGFNFVCQQFKKRIILWKRDRLKREKTSVEATHTGRSENRSAHVMTNELPTPSSVERKEKTSAAATTSTGGRNEKIRNESIDELTTTEEESEKVRNDERISDVDLMTTSSAGESEKIWEEINEQAAVGRRKKTENGGDSEQPSGSDTAGQIQGPFFCTEEHVQPAVCVYEWSGGQLHLGIRYYSRNKKQLKTISCCKPIGVISGDHDIIKLNEPGNQSLKLNSKDIQVNPNENYCVCTLCERAISLSHKTDKKDNKKSISLCIKNKSVFLKDVKSAVMSYIE